MKDLKNLLNDEEILAFNCQSNKWNETKKEMKQKKKQSFHRHKYLCS